MLNEAWKEKQTIIMVKVEEVKIQKGISSVGFISRHLMLRSYADVGWNAENSEIHKT